MLPTAVLSALRRCSRGMISPRWQHWGGSALGAIAALTLLSPQTPAQTPTVIAQTGNPVIRQTAPIGPYIVAVPGDRDALARVRRFYPDAFLDVARQGSFVNAGSFFGRESANARASALRAEGLDARILYRAVSVR